MPASLLQMSGGNFSREFQPVVDNTESEIAQCVNTAIDRWSDANCSEVYCSDVNCSEV